MLGKPLTILIVDDQEGVRYLLEAVVAAEGHESQTARNGLEAVEQVRKSKPDLVFMDIRMPVMDGFEALACIKMISPKTEVVVMSANDTEEAFHRALHNGAIKCISKPFNVNEIRKTIDDFFWHIDMEEEEDSKSFYA